MSLIVDTYNVTHVVGILPPDLAGIDTLGLIRLLANSRFQREKITLVCDGIPHENAPTGRFGSINVRYAGSNRLADDLIKELVRTSSTPKRLIVVTLDQEIIRAAKKRRCKTLGSDDFLKQLAFDHRNPTGSNPEQRPQGTLGPGEIKDWTHHFGLEEDEFDFAEAQSQASPPEPDNPSATTETPASLSESSPELAPDSPMREIPIIQHLPPELLREAERLMEEETPPEASGPNNADAEEDTMDR